MPRGYPNVALLLALLTSLSPLGAEERPPNIVFVLVDDMGYGDLSCYGAPDAQTPHLDQLATEGVRFTRFYAMGAECSPSRTAFLTGRYAQRVGGLECAIGTGNVGRYDDAIRLAEKGDLGLPSGDSILGHAVKKQGYATAVFGKWHMGYERKFFPDRHGFDEFVGFLGGNVDYFRHRELSPLHVLFDGSKEVERKGYMTHLITDDAIGFISRHSNKPFLLYAAYSTPHFPFQAPGDDTGKMHPEDQFTTGTREKYVEMLEDMDSEVGRLLKALRKENLVEDTLFVFASDHGAMPPGRNLPLSGWKGGLMEGGIRVPCIARWPGHLPAGRTSRQVGTLMDLTRSFLRVAGVNTEDLRPELDGIDILEHIEKDRADYDRALFWRARRGDRTWRAVRIADLKLVSRTEGAKTEKWLFNLAQDEEETQDLSGSRPEVMKRLEERLAQWEKQVAPKR